MNKQELIAEAEKEGFKNTFHEGDPIWTIAHNQNLNLIAYLLSK